ncbi:MAG: Phosphoribosylamine--glycine ligase [Candidatus Ozemobacter sibiricus]|uniref:Phosphoribosylamine--glycine ligase n=1 Tax=Candidatus Ozemobacter sibiricus TaxID=2268124 RepID=A0A367ZIR2_9BACT|nr:MAG: Phosphoribosylamine--glycine ligase [Candidatus Ozemobacter sibiricus]
MKVVVIGGGGREAALAWKLIQTLGHANVYRVRDVPRPASTTADPRSTSALVEFADWCRNEGIGHIIPGPEAVLAEGFGEALAAVGGPPVIGPTRAAARLESSKTWAKEFMLRHGVATASAVLAESIAAARRQLDRFPGPVVVKYDGLAAGKGVHVCTGAADAQAALDQIEARFGSAAPVVLEECLTGDEISLIGFTDGETCRLFPPAQDHKQLEDGDRGPNTGGMGAFAPVPWCQPALLEEIEQRIVAPTLRGLRADGLPYAGPLFFGLMITAQGPRLLEYNVRFGDPEAQVLLPLLADDLFGLYLAAHKRRLGSAPPLRWHPVTTVGVVLAAPRYPEGTSHGLRITGLDDLPADLLVFPGGMRQSDAGWETDGGRILTIVGQGPTLEAARQRAYAGVEAVSFIGRRFRRDIGRRPRRALPTTHWQEKVA